MDAAERTRGRNPVSKHQIQPEYGDEQADGGRDCPYSKSMDQPGKVANPARGQLNRLHETDSAVPTHVRLLFLHIQAEYGAYLLRDST